ncbi:MAG: type I-C CRISPR-associated protein Cas8c/Csd1, partial [Clostridia bacterium]|nr:type I-C CRISPR-associated protein Cas8c/Csd1 [Clostridia bacterium]
TSGVKANLLWDTAEYSLGISENANKKTEEKRLAFLNKLEETFIDAPALDIVKPLIHFLKSNPAQSISDALNKKCDESSLKIWNDEISKGKVNLTFKLDGDSNTFADNEALRDSYLNSGKSETSGSVRCLITGDKCIPEATHASIKNVLGAQSSGAALISFNLSAFKSFGKDQNHNAPVSEEAAFKYTTALNQLLEKGSNNKVTIGDSTTVFWAERKNPLEDDFPAFFGYTIKDNPDAEIKAVQNLYQGVYTGRETEYSSTRFYVLGLSPNASRISVRFWLHGTVSEFAKNIKQHFDDLEIIRPPKDQGHYSLFWILSAISQENKTSNIPPVIAGNIVESILTGRCYPQTMLQQTLRRIRATHDISRIRAAVLKAYLNRFNRTYQKPEKEITMSLDTENKNIGYLLGRLFSALERIQEDANPGLNATIKDRFYGAASATPVTVFPQLLKLAQHHLSKMENVGYRINRERLLGEIFQGISDIPAHLSMEDQARFAIGYYHQQQNFFTKKVKNESEKTNEQEI